uniref:Reverse transcriptase domain-containing protein n=1 Tax=Anolis carolinensis TaxID=28377 RepID=A0A803TW76_ANOCA
MRIPSHLVCLLRNLYNDQVATVRTDHGTTDWFNIRKGVWQGCILSPSLFNLYAEHIMRHAGLEESKAGVKIGGRNINNLTLMAESEEEPRGKKEENAKAGLQLNVKKTKIMATKPIDNWQIEGENVEAVTDFIFIGAKITADADCSQEIRRREQWYSP